MRRAGKGELEEHVEKHQVERGEDAQQAGFHHQGVAEHPDGGFGDPDAQEDREAYRQPEEHGRVIEANCVVDPSRAQQRSLGEVGDPLLRVEEEHHQAQHKHPARGHPGERAAQPRP